MGSKIFMLKSFEWVVGLVKEFMETARVFTTSKKKTNDLNCFCLLFSFELVCFVLFVSLINDFQFLQQSDKNKSLLV